MRPCSFHLGAEALRPLQLCEAERQTKLDVQHSQSDLCTRRFAPR